MKKISLFAAIIAAAMLSGAVTAYTVIKTSDKVHSRSQEADRNSPFSSASHFTSYQQQAYPDLTYAAENAVKGVVGIEVTQEVEVRSQRNISPYEFFFGIPDDAGQKGGSREVKGSGSGVIISGDGYIVTNNHVIKGATKIKVTLNDKRTYDAKLIGTDPNTDVALIKIEATNLPMIPFGDSEGIRLGEWVLAIGSPYQLESTITAGIVSAKARTLGALGRESGLESFIQTDAAVNQGNSGGALVNTAGELVGINTIITSPNGSFIGYSFAVPTAIVKKIVSDLMEHGAVQQAQLGIRYSQIDDAFIEQEGKNLGITEKGGMYIADVIEGSAAQEAGVKKGDILTHFNNTEISNANSLQYEIGKLRPADKATITIKRGGQVKHIDVILRNTFGEAELVTNAAVAADVLGGNFVNLGQSDLIELRIEYGVGVRSVSADGVLAKAGVKSGYVITEINGKPIKSTGDLYRIKSNIESIKGIDSQGRIFSFSPQK